MCEATRTPWLPLQEAHGEPLSLLLEQAKLLVLEHSETILNTGD